MINIGLAVAIVGAGLILGMPIGPLIAFAEVIQFLCLFALICIPNYPYLLNLIYNAEFPWNLNLFPISNFDLFGCSNIQSDEVLKENYNNHPSIKGISFICNTVPVYSDLFSISLIVFLLSFLLQINVVKGLTRTSELNKLCEIVQGSFIVFMVVIFVNFTFVTLNRE